MSAEKYRVWVTARERPAGSRTSRKVHRPLRRPRVRLLEMSFVHVVVFNTSPSHLVAGFSLLLLADRPRDGSYLPIAPPKRLEFPIVQMKGERLSILYHDEVILPNHERQCPDERVIGHHEAEHFLF